VHLVDGLPVRGFEAEQMSDQDESGRTGGWGHGEGQRSGEAVPIGEGLLAAVAELGRIVLSEVALEEVFARVAEVARNTVVGADEVSVTMVGGERANTSAGTSSFARRLDERQYAESSGPCLRAAQTGETFLIAAMTTETRWPKYTAQAAADGALSSLSVALPVHGDPIGAINLYARRRDAFDEHDQQVAEHFAGYAAVAVTNAALYAATAHLAGQIKQAMASRAVIEQAKGIIMGERRCTEDQAFARLAKLSQDTNRKLRDVAAALVEQATPPMTIEDRPRSGNGRTKK